MSSVREHFFTSHTLKFNFSFGVRKPKSSNSLSWSGFRLRTKKSDCDPFSCWNKLRRCVCASPSECRSECDSCFNKNFCTRCRAGFYLHLGKCQESCPDGLVHSDAQRECVPREYPGFTAVRKTSSSLELNSRCSTFTSDSIKLRCITCACRVPCRV